MYDDFDDWFYEIESFSSRSERFFGDIQCPDPFRKQKIMIDWLKTAWELGKNSNKK
jgi:hypothetical protein